MIADPHAPNVPTSLRFSHKGFDVELTTRTFAQEGDQCGFNAAISDENGCFVSLAQCRHYYDTSEQALLQGKVFAVSLIDGLPDGTPFGWSEDAIAPKIAV